jgi:predicted dehydrogenase
VNKQIAGGGYFYDMAPHTIDILMFLLGKIVKATGIAGNVGNLYKVEDTVSASFLFESGVTGSAIWCYVSSETVEQDRIEIIGEKGVIRFSTFAFSDIECIVSGKTTETFHLAKPQHIQQPIIQQIVDEMLGAGQSPSTGETGMWTNWVMDQILK